MRRSQVNSGSQPVRNMLTNPGAEGTGGTTVNVRTNLCTNPSFETNLTGWQGAGSPVATVSRVSEQFRTGGWSAKSVCTGSNQGIFLSNGRVAARPGETFTVSVYMMGEVGKTMRLESRFLDVALGLLVTNFTSTVTADGTWQRLSFTSTAPANTLWVDVVCRSMDAGAHNFYTDSVLIEKSPVLGTDFDGSTTAVGDFTYVWSGAAHASTSFQRGVQPTSLVISTSATIQSTEWVSSGTKSARNIPLGSADSYLVFGGDVGGLRAGMEPGKTYTATGTLRLAAPQVGSTSPSRARGLTAFTKVGAAAYVETNSTQATNAVGVTRVRLTFTVPAGATEAAVRAYNGASQGNGDVWWDDLMLVEGTYTGDYVDGTKPFSKWDGTANASTSVGYPPQLLDLAGKPDVDITTVSTTTLSGGWTNTEGRTIYTVYNNLLDIPDSTVYPLVAYGATALNDTIPNQFLTLRLQAGAGSDNNNIISRRTGGPGAVVSGSRSGVNVACWGLRGTGDIFILVNNGAATIEAVMDMPHEKMQVFSPSAAGSHIRTLIYRGYHDPTTRAAISRYLGNKYSALVA